MVLPSILVASPPCSETDRPQRHVGNARHGQRLALSSSPVRELLQTLFDEVAQLPDQAATLRGRISGQAPLSNALRAALTRGRCPRDRLLRSAPSLRPSRDYR